MEDSDKKLSVSIDYGRVKFGYVDENKRLVIPHIYEGAWEFSGEYAKVSCGKGRRGLINKQGEVKLPCIYHDISTVKYDSAIIVDNNKMKGLVDMKNGYVLPSVFEDIKLIGRNDDGLLLCEVTDGWDWYPLTLTEHPEINDRIVTYDKLKKRYPLISPMEAIRDKKCGKCGGRLLMSYYSSSPESWAHLAGSEGYLTFCVDCGKEEKFECLKLN